jgi:hypothetical protein
VLFPVSLVYRNHHYDHHKIEITVSFIFVFCQVLRLMLRLFLGKSFFIKIFSVEIIFRCLACTKNYKYFFIFLFNYINL